MGVPPLAPEIFENFRKHMALLMGVTITKSDADLPLWYACFLCFAIGGSYVLSLYLIPQHIRSMHRDEPLHIKYRLLASCSSTILSVLLMYSVISDAYAPHNISFTTALGLRLDTLLESSIVTIGLMCIFYAGPITTHISMLWVVSNHRVSYSGELVAPQNRGALALQVEYMSDLLSTDLDIVFIRNLIYAPVSEEVVFRALMLPILFSALAAGRGWSPLGVALVSPLMFSSAHLHHVVQGLRDGLSIRAVLKQLMLQMVYTFIFGVMAAVLFFRTGNLAAPIVAHIICNFVGLPDVGFNQPAGPSGSRLSCLYRHRHALLFMHAAGLVLFVFALPRFTRCFGPWSPYAKPMSFQT